MTTPVIIDIIVTVVLVGFTIYGARRGLLRALAGLLVVVVALVGAGIVAATFTPPLTKVITPLIADHIEKKVDAALAEDAAQAPRLPEEETADGPSVETLLDLLGLDQEVRESLAEQAGEKIRDTGATIAAAVVESIAQSMIYGALFLLSFVGLTVLLKILVRAMDLVLQLPGLHLLNTLGGAVFGLAEGALVLFLFIWAARRLGVSFDTEILRSAHILHIFTSNTPLSVLTFLQ